MHMRPALVLARLACAALPVIAEAPGGMDYEVKIDKVFAAVREPPGKPSALYVTVQFKLLRAGDALPVGELGDEEAIVVEEDGRPVADIDLAGPKANALTAVLAMDASGSMAGPRHIDAERGAAG